MRFRAEGALTHSVVMRSHSMTTRWIEARAQLPLQAALSAVFTGIVERVARITRLETAGGRVELEVEAGAEIAREVRIGDSVALSRLLSDGRRGARRTARVPGRTRDAAPDVARGAPQPATR